MHRKRIAIAVAALLVAAGATAAAFPEALGLGGRSAEPLTLYGNVDIRQVELAFRISGRVDQLLVDEGDRVEEGALLATLDPGPQEDAVRAARAEVAAQEAILARLEAGSRPAEIERARAALDERRAALDNARRLHERRARLLESGAIARASFDESLAQVQQLEAQVESARRTLQLALEGPRREEIDQARAAVDAARARLAAAETALADTRLLAPSAGVILSRVREKGAMVSPAEPVFVLALRSPLYVRAWVSEPNLGKIHPGREVEIRTDSRPDRPYRGQVGFVSPVAEFTPKSVETEELRTELVYRLRIVVEDADEGLLQGMPVTIRLPSGGGVASR